MAANSVSSEPAAKSAAPRGFEPFFPLATSSVRRRCLVAVANCSPPPSIRCGPFPCAGARWLTTAGPVVGWMGRYRQGAPAISQKRTSWAFAGGKDFAPGIRRHRRSRQASGSGVYPALCRVPDYAEEIHRSRRWTVSGALRSRPNPPDGTRCECLRLRPPTRPSCRGAVADTSNVRPFRSGHLGNCGNTRCFSLCVPAELCRASKASKGHPCCFKAIGPRLTRHNPELGIRPVMPSSA